MDSQRVIVIVLDGAGAGAAADAAEYGDEGSDTLGNVLRQVPELDLPNLRRLGLYRVLGPGWTSAGECYGAYGVMEPMSAGKDTVSGHWELMGIVVREPFRTFPGGFPPDVIRHLEAASGRGVIGNRAASGTAIIAELGEEHLRTGNIIVYTSADSVLQIAAHEDVVPPEELYRICVAAREIMRGPHLVGRIIARPFAGVSGAFYRTERRRDFALAPPGRTVLDAVKDAGMEVVGIGKIEDIFRGQGLTQVVHTGSNAEGMEAVLRAVEAVPPGMVFCNLVDFDMVYGHRNNTAGFAAALAEFDAFLPRLQEVMGEWDVVFVTADHGCDPTTPSTDHSRENVPVLAWGRRVPSGAAIGRRKSFADLGATVAEILGLDFRGAGKSFATAIGIGGGDRAALRFDPEEEKRRGT